jgi:hypothetical protein
MLTVHGWSGLVHPGTFMQELSRQQTAQPQAGASNAAVCCAMLCCAMLCRAVQVAQNYLKQDQLFHTVLHLPVVLAAVSSAVQDILQQEFGRSSLLIPNGIDCDRFQPGPYNPLDSSSSGVNVDSSNADAPGPGDLSPAAATPAAGDASAEALAAAADGDCAGSSAAASAGLRCGSNVPADAPQGPIASADGMAEAAAEAAGGSTLNDSQASASSLDVLAAAAAEAEAPHVTPMDVTAPSGLTDEAGQPAALPQHAEALNPATGVALNPGRPLGLQKKRVLLVGNPALPLKGFPTAIAALTAVSAVLPIKIRWLCQVSRVQMLDARGLCSIK